MQRKIIIDTLDEGQMDSDSITNNNSKYQVKVTMYRKAQYMQLDSFVCQNFFSNISFPDFSYYLGNVYTSFPVSQNQGYTVEQFRTLMEDEGFTVNLGDDDAIITGITYTGNANWRPIGKGWWAHLGMSKQQLLEGVNKAEWVPDGFLGIQSTYFKIKFDEFQSNKDISYIVPFNAAFGEQQLYIRGSASEQICLVTDQQFSTLTFQLFDRFDQPLYCKPSHKMQIVMQLSY